MISGEMSRLPAWDLRRQEAVDTCFFAPVLPGETLATVLSSHPSPDVRLARRDRISGRLWR